jgi:hypothetical protein
LTGSTVAREMKFRDQVREPELADIKVWVVVRKAFEVMD